MTEGEFQSTFINKPKNPPLRRFSQHCTPEENSAAPDTKFPEACTESEFPWGTRFQCGYARKFAALAKFGRRSISAENPRQKSRKSARAKKTALPLRSSPIRKFLRTARQTRFRNMTGRRYWNVCASRPISPKG